MKEKKGLYPDKSVYTQQIGPGFCFGALALMLRFFFEVPVCRVNHPDFTRRKGHYQDRRPPPSHRWAASSLGQNPAQVRVSGVGVPGSGGRDECPFLPVPIPAPGLLIAVWAGRGVTPSDAQGDARSLFSLLSESQGHGQCFLQPYVILKMALSNASEVFWKLGTGDLRTPRRATAGTGYNPGTARSKAGSRQRLSVDSQGHSIPCLQPFALAAGQFARPAQKGPSVPHGEGDNPPDTAAGHACAQPRRYGCSVHWELLDTTSQSSPRIIFQSI